MTVIMRQLAFRQLPVLILSLVLPSQVLAQSPITVDSGKVVRMSLPDDTVEGRLIAPASSSIALISYCRYPGPPCHTLLDAGIDSVETSRVVHLDVANGSNWERGALIGGAIGAAIGGIGLSFAHGGFCELPECEGDAVWAAIGITIAGAAVGAVFGATSLTWEPIW